MREDIGNRKAYATFTKNKDGSYSLINRTSKFSAPLHSSAEMNKKGDAIIIETKLSIQSDEERELFKSFLNGTLNASTLPEAPKRGRPSKNGDTKTPDAPTTGTPETAAAISTPAPTTDLGRIGKATPDQIKMASALVNAKQAKDLDSALQLLGV